MGYSDEKLERIFDRTSGYCHLCSRKLAFCNELKGTNCTKRSRAVHGRTRAPYSVNKRQQKREDNAFRKGILTGAAGGAMFGPPGAIVGALFGAISGYDENPDW